MNLAQLRSPSILVLTLAAANLTLLGQDRPQPDRPAARDGHGEQGERGPQPDRARMIQEGLNRLKHEIAELREAGKKEEAQAKEQQLAATMRQLSQDRPMQDGVRGPERMQHLEQAIRHVEAAGLPEVSRDLRKVAAHLREEMERQEREASVRRGGSAEGDRGEVKDLRRELERNRDEMQRMQREIRELRAKVGLQSPAPDRHE